MATPLWDCRLQCDRQIHVFFLEGISFSQSQSCMVRHDCSSKHDFSFQPPPALFFNFQAVTPTPSVLTIIPIPHPWPSSSSLRFCTWFRWAVTSSRPWSFRSWFNKGDAACWPNAGVWLMMAGEKQGWWKMWIYKKEPVSSDRCGFHLLC